MTALAAFKPYPVEPLAPPVPPGGSAAHDPRRLPGTEANARASSPAFDRLIELMAEVIEYPNDPVRTFPTNGLISGA